MNYQNKDLDRVDEESLTFDVSDDALEAAAGADWAIATACCFTNYISGSCKPD